MFDFAWSEIGLIAAVALILIGPKDMPVAIRTITDMIKKARRMASEFQTHVDEMMRDANLGEVRDQISAIRNFDIRGELERHIDPDRSLRDTFAGNPLEPTAAGSATAGAAPELESSGDLALAPEPAAFGPPTADEAAAHQAAADAAAQAEAEAAAVAEAAAAEAAAAAAREPEIPPAPAFVPPGFLPPRTAAADDIEPPPFIPPQAVLQRGSRPAA